MFAFLILLAPHALIDQTHFPVPAIDKESASYSAMVAAKETLHLLTKFSSLKYGLDFSNYDVVMDNYSVSLGFRWLWKDSFIYFFIGLILEACLSGVSLGWERVKLAKIANKQVSTVQNPNYNEITEHSRIINEATTIRKTGLQVIDLRLSPDQVNSINISVKPGELCCLTGTNSDLHERLHFLQVISSEAVINHGQVLLNGNEQGSLLRSTKSQIRIMPLLTASENLLFYMGLDEGWLDGSEVKDFLKRQFQ